MGDLTRSDILVGRLITALGALLLGIALWIGYGRYVILRHWPTTQAEVTKSEVSGPSRMGRSITSDSVYYTEIEFQFAVDGRPFKASARDKSDNWSGAKMVANTYAPGTRHPIRYNPVNPEDIRFSAVNTLELPVFLGIIGVGVFSGGLRWLLQALERSRKRQRALIR